MKSSAVGGFKISKKPVDIFKHLKLQTKSSFMKLPYSLLITTLTLSFALSTSSESLAFGGPPGGPFSNGSYFPNDGTFSAVVRGENLTGTLQFSTTSGAGASVQLLLTNPQTGEVSLLDTQRGQGSTGVSTIFYNGDTYLGNSQGSLNPEASTMTINFQGDSEGQGEQQFEQINASVNGIPGYTKQVSYFSSFYLNGFANCKTSNSFPNQKFEGNGEAEFQQVLFDEDIPYVDAVRFNVSVTGVRLSNTASTFSVSTIRGPSVDHYITEFP